MRLHLHLGGMPFIMRGNAPSLPTHQALGHRASSTRNGLNIPLDPYPKTRSKYHSTMLVRLTNDDRRRLPELYYT